MSAEKTPETVPYSVGWDDEDSPAVGAAVAGARAAVEPAPSPARPAPSIAAARDPAAKAPGGSADPAIPTGAPSPAPAAPPPPPPPQRRAVEIPLSDDLDRFPALFARSAIFRIGRADHVGDEQPAQLPCHEKDCSVLYQGPRLGMRDKRVWELAVRAAKRKGGAGVEFTLSCNEIAQALRPPRQGPEGKVRKPSGRELKRAQASIKRLARAKLEYRVPGMATSESAKLLATERRHPKGWTLSLDAGLVKAFAEDKQFRMNAARREELSTDLAKWLHDFMSTHGKTFEKGFALAELSELCGWIGDKGAFPAKLRAALKDLVAACPDLVKGFEIVRIGRESTDWRARVDRGPEPALYLEPAKLREREANKAAKRKPARSGGVAL